MGYLPPPQVRRPGLGALGGLEGLLFSPGGASGAPGEHGADARQEAATTDLCHRDPRLKRRNEVLPPLEPDVLGQEAKNIAKNRADIPLQEKFHRGMLRGLRNISDTP